LPDAPAHGAVPNADEEDRPILNPVEARSGAQQSANTGLDDAATSSGSTNPTKRFMGDSLRVLPSTWAAGSHTIVYGCRINEVRPWGRPQIPYRHSLPEDMKPHARYRRWRANAFSV
jgi:hypothetical protein